METETEQIKLFTVTLDDVSRVVNHLGQFEYRLAVSKCGEGASLNDIVAAIEEHREPLMRALGCNIGSSIMLTAETWQKLADESDAAAKRELLRDSKALKGVERLMAEANAAKEAARKAQEVFDRDYAELDGIPARIDMQPAPVSDHR